jgi:hypothetical protein
MPSRIQAPNQGEQPKTLFEARELIKKLRSQLPGTSAELGITTPPVHGTAGTIAPIPKATAPPRPNPDPSKPGRPGAQNREPFKMTGMPCLAALAPKALKTFLEERTGPELQALLRAETSKDHKSQDLNVVAAVYKEIKSR